MEEEMDTKDKTITQKIVPARPTPKLPITEKMLSSSLRTAMWPESVSPDRLSSIRKRDVEYAQMLQERCLQLCLSIFFRPQKSVRSLGFTSAVGGEGKSFLSAVTAGILANDSNASVTLLECNWEHPSLHDYFGFPSVPGLAEWLRDECQEMNIRHRVDNNLTVIPAGSGKRDAVKLLQQIQSDGLLNIFARPNELFIVDLPSTVTTAYGPLAANLVETVIIVVRAGVTPRTLIAEACTRLSNASIRGVVLNQVESRIPYWIRQIL